MSNTVLFTNGCSFANCTRYRDEKLEDNKVWPLWLHDRMPDSLHVTEGLGGQGNQMIAHRTQYRLQKVLQQHRAEDILAVIMWTGSDRWQFFHTEDLGFPRVTGEEVNPVKFIDDPTGGYYKGSWVLTHPQYIHERNDLFYKYFYDPIWMQIQTLEAVINTQRYLREKGIRYVMSTAFNTCFDPNLKNSPNVDWLWEQIDWEPWLPVKSMKEWCDATCPILGVNNFHPRPEQCEKFVDQILWPYLLDKKLV